MAKVTSTTELRLPRDNEEEEPFEQEIETLDSSPFSSESHNGLLSLDRQSIFSFDPNPDRISARIFEFYQPPGIELEMDEAINDCGACVVEVLSSSDDCSDADFIPDLNNDPTGDDDLDRRDSQVSLVVDLFEGCSGRSFVVGDDDDDDSLRNPFHDDDPFFGVMDDVEENNNDERVSNFDELGLGLGLGFDKLEDDDVGFGDDIIDFMIDECADEIFAGRRAESAESSARRGRSVEVEPFQDGLRVVGIESESDEEEGEVVGVDGSRVGEEDDLDRTPDDLGLALCWDCLRLEDQRESNDDFECEWEEVDERIEEREVLNMVIDVDEEEEVERSISIQSEGVDDDGMEEANWEVLLAVNNLGGTLAAEHDFDPEDYIHTAEYEMLVGQFTDEFSTRGSPPAAKSVVENLPSLVLIQEDEHNENALCAICKDEILIEDLAKLLPCAHYYHGECIFPWLNIRNTCPVCRFELPTDDPAYEQRRIEREFDGNFSRAPQTRFDFEIFLDS